MGVVDHVADRTERPSRGLCILLLSDEEFALFDAVVELVTEQCEEHGVTLDTTSHRARSLVVSALVAAYLEQQKAVIEAGE